MTRERIEAIADELDYHFWTGEVSWEDYCASVMGDPSVTDDQVREELMEYKRIEEEENA